MNLGGPVLRVLDWDTAFFGRRIATFTRAPASEADVRAGIEEARAAGVECVYALCDVDAQVATEALAASGARFVDLRLTFEKQLAPRGPVLSDSGVRTATSRDVPELRALAAASHGSSRFYADRRFPREQCDELFASWIETSVGGWADVVHVAEMDGRVSGYTTGHVRAGGRSEIGLVAVDARAQGRGVGGALVTTTLAHLHDRGALSATVITQGRNLRAQRLYQALGFRTLRVQTWHHLWLDEARA